MRRLVLLLAVLIFAGAVAAHADRDILYGARYYLKPGSTGKSYSHIYRINPDGSGRVQITFGAYNDTVCRWSPNGRSILFRREAQDWSALCITGASGGRVRTLVKSSKTWDLWEPGWAPGGDRVAYTTEDGSVNVVDIKTGRPRALFKSDDFVWSPDGQSIYGGVNGTGGRILDLKTGKSVKVDAGAAAVWLDNNTLVAEKFDELEDVPPVLGVFDRQGKEKKTVTLDANLESGFPNFADALYTIPGSRQRIIYGLHSGDSTSGPQEQFLVVDLSSGSAKEIVSGQFLSWSPDGRRFCTGDVRWLEKYGDGRRVWVSPLRVVTLSTRESRDIVSGLVMVEDFDWRK